MGLTQVLFAIFDILMNEKDASSSVEGPLFAYLFI